MKLPRDISGRKLAKALQKLGYEMDYQTGSHIRLVTSIEGEHHVSIPNHRSIKVGLLNGILKEVAQHFRLTRDEILEKLGL